MKSPFWAEKLTANLARGTAKMGISVPSGAVPISWPYRGKEASIRRVSRAPRPAGRAPSSTSRFHSHTTSSLRTYTS